MKKRILILMLIITMALLVACNNTTPPLDDRTTEGTTETTTNDQTPEPLPADLPYTMIYTSNGDGTCYVSDINIDPLHTEKFTLTIPESSPEGDRVIGVDTEGFESYIIPRILTRTDFDEIDAKLQAKVEEGELEEYSYLQVRSFYLAAFFSEQNSQKAKENFLEQYPFGELTDFYILGDATTREKAMISERLALIGYTFQDLVVDEVNLRTIIEQSNLENKDAVIQNLSTVTDKLGQYVETVELPQGLEWIGSNAFMGLANLKTITIPDSVMSVGNSAFYGCDNLVYTEHSNAYYLGNSENPYVVLSHAKSTDIVSCEIPATTRCIHKSAFEDCSSLENVMIGQNSQLISIGEYAFHNCRSLINFAIPSGVMRIGISAFEDCRSLTSVAVPDGVARLGSYTFSNCINLSELTFGNSLQYIGNNAFAGCRSLTSITIPDSVTEIGEKAFAGYIYMSDSSVSSTSDQGPVSVTFGKKSQLTSIGACAFAGCNRLTAITIPDGAGIPNLHPLKNNGVF